MKKYFVTLPFYASANLVVLAENEQDAIEKAFQKQGSPPNVCHQCSDYVDIGDWCEDGATAESEECEHKWDENQCRYCGTIRVSHL